MKARSIEPDIWFENSSPIARLYALLTISLIFFLFDTFFDSGEGDVDDAANDENLEKFYVALFFHPPFSVGAARDKPDGLCSLLVHAYTISLLRHVV